MRIRYYLLVFSFFYSFLSAQDLKITSVSPLQAQIGVASNSNILVKLNQPINTLLPINKQIIKVFGSSSGIINGVTEIDSVSNSYIFTPANQYKAGEIINISFGPVVSISQDTLKSFNWQFTVEIINLSNAKFDSLARFNLPSFYPITMDYNHDGFVDIISGLTGTVLLNNKTGGFTQSLSIPELVGASFINDLNNDNILDLVVNNTGTGEVVIFRGTNAESYLLSQVLYPFEQIGGIIIAEGDINGDGYIDLISKEIYGINDCSWRIFLNNGSGEFIRDPSLVNLQNWISEAKLIDMDKDGDLDLVLLNTWAQSCDEFDGVFIYYNDGLGHFNIFKQIEFVPSVILGRIADLRQLFVTDFDHNGYNDIAAFGSMNGGLILLQNSLGEFHCDGNTSFGGAENFAFFTAGDVNGDNRIDVIVSNYQVCQECGEDAMVTFEADINCEQNYFWGNTTSGGIFELGTRDLVGNAVTPITADIDNDGDLDIIHAGYPTIVTYNHTHIVEVEKTDIIPNQFCVSQNYPNPFNGSTNISYSIPQSGNVKITVYNSLGQMVKILAGQVQSAGTHNLTFDASNLSSGLYFYKIDYASQSQIKKMLYLK